MNAGAWAWLLRREARAQRPRLLILGFCLFLSATIFGLTWAAVSYLRSELRPRLRELFPERRVVVTPSQSDFFLLRVQGPGITDDVVRQFRAMPEVENVYTQLSASFPVSADFEMESVGMGFTTDIILFGVDEEMLKKDVDPAAWQIHERRHDGRVPVLISEYFLDAYNLGLAESSGMPKLSRSAVIGIEFDLLLGESTMGLGEAKSGPKTVKARVAGMTANPLLFGVTMPLDELRTHNHVYTPEKKDAYAALYLDSATPDGIPAIKEKAKELKLNASAQADVLNRYLRIVGTIEGLLAAMLALVLALAGVGVFTTTAAALRDLRPRWGLYRATGFPPRGVMVLALGFTLMAALPAGGLAGAACGGIGALLSHFLGDTIANLSVFPGDPFRLSVGVYTAVMVFAVVFGAIPALLFAWPVSKGRPGRFLSERSL